MDINFDAAIQFINMGKYEMAVEHLQKAIAAEENSGRSDAAIECTCVLGELLANMGETDRARKEFDKVIEYCTRTHSLEKQQEIARDFIDRFDRELLKNSAPPIPFPSRNEPNTIQTSVFLQ